MSEVIAVSMREGDCPVHVLRPQADGCWPAAIMYMDAGGIRPAMVAMAQRLADAGYIVLLPDLFYRFGPYGPLVPREVFAGDVGAILGPLMATTGNNIAAEDTGALLGLLDSRADVVGGKVGAVGFCMGGGMALASAGTWPESFGAVASFHGGNLATDASDSPHLYAARLAGEVLIAAATDDASYPPAMAERLETALDEGGVSYCAEVYPAAHGWMMPDFPVHDAAAAERGWAAMLALFGRTLQAGA